MGPAATPREQATRRLYVRGGGMTSRKDIDQFLERFLATPGCVVERCATSEGHHVAYRIDENGERTTSRVTVPSTPSSYAQLARTRHKFKTYLSWRDPATRRGKAEPRKHRAKQPPPTPKEPPTMAKVSGAEALVRRILNEPYSPELVRLAIVDAAQQIDPATNRRKGEPRHFQDKPGVKWSGDLYKVFRGLWDDLPPARNNPHMQKLATGLLSSLKNNGDLHLLNDDVSNPLWWVSIQSGEWPEPDAVGQTADGEGGSVGATVDTANDLQAAADTDSSAAPASPASPPSPEHDPESPTSMKLVRCETPGCAYTDTPHAMVSHKGRLGTNPHPDGVYPCPKCPVVRTTLTSFKQHMRKNHDFRGDCCSTCLGWFDGRASLMGHNCPGRPHGVQFATQDLDTTPSKKAQAKNQASPPAKQPGTGLDKPVPAPRAPAPEPAVSGKVAAPPSSNGSNLDGLDPVAVARAASEMLARHADMLQDSTSKDAKIAQLTEQNEQLRRGLNEALERLNALTSALGSLDSLRSLESSAED